MPIDVGVVCDVRLMFLVHNIIRWFPLFLFSRNGFPSSPVPSYAVWVTSDSIRAVRCMSAVAVVWIGDSVCNALQKWSFRMENGSFDLTCAIPMPSKHRCCSKDCLIRVTSISHSFFAFTCTHVQDFGSTMIWLTTWSFGLPQFVCTTYYWSVRISEWCVLQNSQWLQ